jgi:hypothetical protein
MKVFILIHTCCNFTSMFQSMFSSKIICLLVIECLYFLLSQLKRSLDYQNAVFAGCRARTPDPPRGRARTVPARGARGVPRASTRHECNPADARRYSRRRGAGEAARQRVSSRPRKEECWDLERRDARAGSKAPKARCTGRVRSAEGAMHGQGQKRICASGRQRRLRRGAERIDERIIMQYTSTSIIILLGSYCLPVRSGPPTK